MSELNKTTRDWIMNEAQRKAWGELRKLEYAACAKVAPSAKKGAEAEETAKINGKSVRVVVRKTARKSGNLFDCWFWIDGKECLLNNYHMAQLVSE